MLDILASGTRYAEHKKNQKEFIKLKSEQNWSK